MDECIVNAMPNKVQRATGFSSLDSRDVLRYAPGIHSLRPISPILTGDKYDRIIKPTMTKRRDRFFIRLIMLIIQSGILDSCHDSRSPIIQKKFVVSEVE